MVTDMLPRLAVLTVAIVALACDSPSPSSQQSPTAVASNDRSSEQAPGHEVSTPQAPGSDASKLEKVAPPADELALRMQDHFASVTKIADAVVDGDLEAAHEAATWFLEHVTESGLPPGWPEHVTRMRAASQRVAEAKDIDAAAAATGMMLASCGQCHRSRGVQPRFPDAIEPTLAETAAAEMERHQWALERLSEGLVGPSDPAWNAGAEILRVPPTCAALAAAEIGDPPAIRTLAVRFGAQAKRARDVRELDARGQLYGDLLGTCAACHRSGC